MQARADYGCRRSLFAIKARHQNHAKLKSILTFAFSASVVNSLRSSGLGHNRPRRRAGVRRDGMIIGRRFSAGY